MNVNLAKCLPIYDFEIECPHGTPETILAYKQEQRRAIDWLIENLSDQHIAVFVAHMAGETAAEIADAAELPEKTIQQIIRRTQEKLRSAFDREPQKLQKKNKRVEENKIREARDAITIADTSCDFLIKYSHIGSTPVVRLKLDNVTYSVMGKDCLNRLIDWLAIEHAGKTYVVKSANRTYEKKIIPQPIQQQGEIHITMNKNRLIQELCPDGSINLRDAQDRFFIIKLVPGLFEDEKQLELAMQLAAARYVHHRIFGNDLMDTLIRNREAA